MEKSGYVRDMFAAIAPRYDAANRVLTAGMDALWRRRAVRELRAPLGATVLDVCCGTGDLAFALARSQGELRIVAVDFCEPMLDAARKRSQRERAGDRVTFVLADALALPYPDASFEGATMGFSMRNVIDIAGTLREIRRVLRPGARFVNLDVTKVRSRFIRPFFALYFYGIVPFVGGLVGGSKAAYRYLPSSLTNYPDAEGVAERFSAAGFGDVRTVLLGFGAIAIHVGTA
ncbi:MAG: bifunctional demethylmenaquinone methyltransferase/2-methoxy-6-polyprenyl-1,4-benzoquinol methylase UbiE [Candidatus Eremiobacteraeota bacterium]|nr:bifunctional demethylmenaquinone methyltransferase/2-methoxy-6-polyprenyl-1,4-benzoquinol methylase UbiE [Candidatus Eremiobacteraeota bacterium]